MDATSLAISSLAISESADAKNIACKSYIHSFDSKTATIQESKQYSECINIIYPKEGSSFLMIVLISSAMIGLFCGMCAHVDDNEGALLNIFICSIVPPALIFACYKIFKLFF